MIKIKQWLNKIPTLVFLIIIFILAFLGLPLGIEKNSPAAIGLSLPYLLCVIILFMRFLNHLRAKGSGWYHIFRFFFGYLLICFAAGFFIILDIQFSLKGFLMFPGLMLEVGLLIWLFIKYRLKRNSSKEKSSSSYSFEKLCDDLSADLEIEFTYDSVRYLFIPENGRYYFKRIVSTDPYEYEILAEASDPLVCLDSFGLNGRKLIVLWSDVKDIKVY